MICNHDCFNCPYEDCINDEAGASDLLATINNDRMARQQKRSMKAREQFEKRRSKARRDKGQLRKFKSEEERTAYYKQYMREYRERYREKLAEYKKAWDRAHLDEQREKHRIYERERRRKAEILKTDL